MLTFAFYSPTLSVMKKWEIGVLPMAAAIVAAIRLSPSLSPQRVLRGRMEWHEIHRGANSGKSVPR